jgi:serine/threonine protein phosphatase PrpC
VLLSAIGHPGLQIDVGPAVPLAAHDTLLLASDGLTDNLTTDEIVRLTSRGTPGEICAILGERTRATMLASDESGKPDDLSLVLFRPNSAT